MPVGHDGVLYPPGSLHQRVSDARDFTRLAPTADDLWLYWMAQLRGTETSVIGPRISTSHWPQNRNVPTLFAINGAGGNDRQLKALSEAIPLR